jgi:hypothetical protein
MSRKLSKVLIEVVAGRKYRDLFLICNVIRVVRITVYHVNESPPSPKYVFFREQIATAAQQMEKGVG